MLTIHQRKFLAVYGKCGNVSAAAAQAMVGRRTHYDWLEDSEEYAEAFADAKEEAIERLEAEVYRRAIASSDVLLMFLLKALAPWKYRDHYRVQHSGPGGQPQPVKVVWNTKPEAALGPVLVPRTIEVASAA